MHSGTTGCILAGPVCGRVGAVRRMHTAALSSHSARTGTVVDTIGCAEEAIRQATGLTPCIRHQQFATCIRVGGGQR